MNNQICQFLLFLSFLGFLGLQSCVEEFDLEKETVTSVSPKEIIKTSLYGKVIDENNQAMTNADIELQTAEGTEYTTTNKYGKFEFLNVRIKGSSAFIKVSAPGKFDGFRRASVIKNALNYTEVKLLEQKIVGTIDAARGGAVSTSSGAQVQLPNNAVVSKDGQAYNGPVSVAMQWINPAAEDLNQRLVGDLSGIDIEGNEVVLGTFGMMVVELLDEQGNELKLADDANAELTWPVPSERLRDAPKDIPVWSYDESLGTWIEEELATQNGNTFVGKVSHFSAWNLDWKGPSITLNGQVTYNGNPGEILSAFRIDVNSPLFGSRGGFLTPDGEFEFLRFPVDEEFTLTIKNICGDIVYQDTYGPYSQNKDLGVINITSSDIDETIVSGVAVDCDMNPIEGALIQLVTDSSSYYAGTTEADGSFELIVPYCGMENSAELFILDPVEKLASTPQTFDITSASEIDLGEIRVCDQEAAFFELTIDTFNDIYTPPSTVPFYSVDGKKIGVEGIPNGGDIQIIMEDQISGPGNYSSNNHYFHFRDDGEFGTSFYTKTDPPNMNVEITEYSDVSGEFIGGNFSGTVNKDSTGLGAPLDVSGEFRIEIQ